MIIVAGRVGVGVGVGGVVVGEFGVDRSRSSRVALEVD